jgi:RNA polymerase-interacting CarD/CdnL/TRCF family regulator
MKVLVREKTIQMAALMKMMKNSKKMMTYVMIYLRQSKTTLRMPRHSTNKLSRRKLLHNRNLKSR